MFFGQRWYDQDPKVSFAVGCIEKASDSLRTKLAKVIIKHCISNGIKAKKPQHGFFRRWYDQNETLMLAMEYFKSANEAQRLDIAELIICYLRESTYINAG
jgi:hypothetical protein